MCWRLAPKPDALSVMEESASPLLSLIMVDFSTVLRTLDYAAHCNVELSLTVKPKWDTNRQMQEYSDRKNADIGSFRSLFREERGRLPGKVHHHARYGTGNQDYPKQEFCELSSKRSRDRL